MVRTIFVLMLLSVAGFATSSAQSVMDVSRAYLLADASMDVDNLRPFYADSVRFEDPTGEVFGGPTAGLAVVGRDSLLAVQAGWGLDPSRFEVDRSFGAGRFAVHHGTYHVSVPGVREPVHIPFVTVHEIVHGRVVSRMDFGEYIESFGLGDRFDAQTRATRAVADRYLAAYTDRNVDHQQALLAPQAVYHDPLGWRRTHPAVLKAFSFDVHSGFAASRHAVFIGNVVMTAASGQRVTHPAVIVLEIDDGKVVKHWDYVGTEIVP